ncbi:MAG: NAD(P)-dependent oxidoreductase [Chloroflexi bacterium]|nr:MAG: NAD(P)-dependent oxidoreductase [Chloroflexota bacterium]
MKKEHFFVTGALGCLGAWIVKNLVQERVQVTVFDLGTDTHRLKLIMDAPGIAQVTFVQGDITNREAVIRAVQQSGATRIIHLAGLQVPACKANPTLGARVNVVGTVNVFEAAKETGIKQVTYASSVAVYGPPTDYAETLVSHNAPLRPRSLYGVYKQANENTAKIYWQDEGIAAIGLRPYIVYGPARDQGMTSAPTKAMMAAAAGQPYHIPYGGTAGYQLADDVARTFIQAARTPFEGADAFNIKGAVVHMSEIVAAIEQAEPSARGRITFDDTSLPFPAGQDDAALKQVLGSVPDTSLAEGVAFTVNHFKKALQRGQINPKEMTR